jgi:YD repeat-containing protein
MTSIQAPAAVSLALSLGVLCGPACSTESRECLPTLIEVDQGNDGVVDRRHVLAHTSDGRLLSSWKDSDGDQLFDHIERNYYDRLGHIVSTVVRPAVDAPPLYRLDFGYDGQGNRISTRRDDGLDGTIESASTARYDELGQLLYRAEDRDGDGVFEERRWYTYDENGRRMSKNVETDGVGVVSSRTAYSYDDAGRLIARRGYLGDYLVELIELGYDDRGHLVRKDFYLGDDVLVRWAIYEYDALGRLVHREDHYRRVDQQGPDDVVLDPSRRGDEDHEPDLERELLVVRQDFRWDEAGNLVEKIYDSTGKEDDYRDTMSYDAAGQLLMRTHDAATPARSVRERFEYDGEGHRIRIETDFGMDGEVDEVERRTFRCYG